MGEIRIGRWCIRWCPKSGPFPFEMVIGRLRKADDGDEC